MRNKREVDQIVKRAEYLRGLLGEFNATLCGFGTPQEGLSAVLPGQRERGAGYWGEALDFNATEWSWLEPLLIELRDYRKGRIRKAA